MIGQGFDSPRLHSNRIENKMSFWKKAFKKFKKQQDKDIKKIVEDKYLNKLQKQINRMKDSTDQSKK